MITKTIVYPDSFNPTGEQFLKGMDDAANDRISGWGTFFKDAWKSLTCQSDKYPNFIFSVMDALNQWITSVIFLPQTVWDLLSGFFSFDPYKEGYSLGTTFFMIFEIILAKAIAEGLTALAEKLGELLDRKIEKAGTAGGVADGARLTRVGRWMSKVEYNKMIETGKVQMSDNGNATSVVNPADPNAFKSQAKPGTIYVEFDVPINSIQPGGNANWGIISGPGSLWDRFYQSKGLPPITEMPDAINIKIVEVK